MHERLSREEERDKLKTLSCYYLLTGTKVSWEGPKLLKQGELGPGHSLRQLDSTHSPALLLVLEDMKAHGPLPRLPTGATP